MKWLVVCSLALFGTRASAELVEDMTPPVARECALGAPWASISACLVKHGWTPHLLRTVPGAKLLHLTLAADADGGLVLYVQRGSTWWLGGVYSNAPMPYEIQTLEALTIGHHTGYRIDLEVSVPESISLDGVTTVTALSLQKRSLYCSGTTWSCSAAVTACDVLVRGKSVWLFRGAVTIGDSDGLVHVAGDRSHSGDDCVAPEVVFLGWPPH